MGPSESVFVVKPRGLVFPCGLSVLSPRMHLEEGNRSVAFPSNSVAPVRSLVLTSVKLHHSALALAPPYRSPLSCGGYTFSLSVLALSSSPFCPRQCLLVWGLDNYNTSEGGPFSTLTSQVFHLVQPGEHCLHLHLSKPVPWPHFPGAISLNRWPSEIILTSSSSPTVASVFPSRLILSLPLQSS